MEDSITARNQHFECLETFREYEGNRVVQDLLTRKPDIFQFLINVMRSQSANPARFTPIPKWFALAETASAASLIPVGIAVATADQLIDMGRFRAAAAEITVDWRLFNPVDDEHLLVGIQESKPITRVAALDAVMLARFMVLSCPLQLDGVSKTIEIANGTSFGLQQMKATWCDRDEQQWEAAGQGATPDYLYHGSPLSNWYSIMRNGLKVTSGTQWMTAGAAYGNGIYCSDDLSVSWGYSRGGLGEIVVGVYEVWRAETYKRAAHGVFVIPAEQLLRLRYLIYVPNSAMVDVVRLNAGLRENWLRVGSNKAVVTRQKQVKVNARVTKELAKLVAIGVEIATRRDDRVTATWQGHDIVIVVPHQFPFTPPEISIGGLFEPAADWSIRATIADVLSLRLVRLAAIIGDNDTATG